LPIGHQGLIFFSSKTIGDFLPISGETRFLRNQVSVMPTSGRPSAEKNQNF
jgi:hypothetical protein